MTVSRTPIALAELTMTIRQRIPFEELTEARVCSGLCIGCPKKLLEYLEQEVLYWEEELDRGETPTLGDINRLARSATKIEKVLIKNQVLPER